MHKLTPHRTAAAALVEQLRINGVEHVFCVPGESFLPVLDALRDSGITVTVCRHEGGAAMMAEAVGKTTGRPGICFVTRGPGATNASAGIHIAQQDSTPMIMFVGQVETSVREREAFQELDYRAVFGSMTKWTVEVDDPGRITEFVSRAFYTASSGRPGPVVVALPKDVLSERVNISNAPPFEPVETSPGEEEMAKLGELLARGQKSAYSCSAAAAGPRPRARQIHEFAERTGLPIATSYRRSTLFDPLHPLYAGDLGLGPNPKLVARAKAADLLVLVGGRLGEIPSQGYSLLSSPSPQTKLVHIHPGAEEIGRVYRPHLAIHASPNRFVAALERLAVTPNPAWRESADGRTCRFSRLDRQRHAAARRCQSRRDHDLAARSCADRHHPVQRRGQLRLVDPSLLPLPRIHDPCRADLGVDGLRHAGGDRDAAAASGQTRSVGQWRRRFPDERPGIRDGGPISPADHRRGLRQRHVRHDPHASGARISRPRQRHRAAQSGFRRLCARLRRLRRGGEQDVGFSGGLRGGAGIAACPRSFISRSIPMRSCRRRRCRAFASGHCGQA